MTNEIDPKKQWFDVRDSKCRGEDGHIYYNVEARFADHKVIDPAESRKAGYAIYRLVPQVHMHVKKTIFETRSIKNSTSVVFRFDKGRDETRITGQVVGPAGTMVPNREGKTGLSKPDFDRAIGLIMRCWDAWEHYQTFRKAPVWPLEEDALKIIAGKPRAAYGVHVVVDRDGNLAEYIPADDGDEEESFDPDGDDDMSDVAMPPPVAEKPKGGRRPKAAAA